MQFYQFCSKYLEKCKIILRKGSQFSSKNSILCSILFTLAPKKWQFLASKFLLCSVFQNGFCFFQLTVHSKVLKHAEDVKRRSMILKVPKQSLKNSAKRRRAGTVEHCDYLSNKNYKNVKRRRTDPLVTLASFLEIVHGELRVMDEALQFLQPVNTKKVVDYLDKIKVSLASPILRENLKNCLIVIGVRQNGGHGGV